MFTTAQNEWLILFLGGAVGEQLAALNVPAAREPAAAGGGPGPIEPPEPAPGLQPGAAQATARDGGPLDGSGDAAPGRDTERFGIAPAIVPVIPVVIEGVKDLFGELVARVSIVNNTGRTLTLDTGSLKLAGGHWKTQPVGKIGPNNADRGIVAHTEKNLLIASTEDVEGTLRYFVGDDKTVWSCHFHNPRIPLVTSNSADGTLKGPSEGSLQKAEDAGPGADAAFTFTLGEPGGGTPTPPPGGQGGVQSSCMVGIVNSSKQTIFLRKQDKVAGDYMTNPPATMAAGASAQFVFVQTPGAKDPGCRGLLTWDVGDPPVASWDLMWDNPHQEKNLSAGRLSPEVKGLHTLDQIGQGDENVPVTFTLSGDGGGGAPPGGARVATVTVSNGTDGPIVLVKQSGTFQAAPPASIAAGGSATVTQQGDAAGGPIEGSLVWIAGSGTTTWHNGWTLPAGAGGSATGGIDPADPAMTETAEATGDTARFGLSGKGAGPAPEKTEFAPPPESKQPTLRKGDESPDGWVEYAQQLLVRNGLKVPVNGAFDGAMDKAVRQFQAGKKCKVDGVIGNETWSMLREQSTKDAVGTDGRQPHTFEQKDAQARFATEKRFTTAYDQGKDLLTLVVMCVGEQSIETFKVTVRPVGAQTAIAVPIGTDMVRSDDGQGNHYLVKIGGFARQFGVTPQSVLEGGIDAYLDGALGGDRWTGVPNQ